MSKYTLKLTEFEILTLREGLYLVQKHNWDRITDNEFDTIDNKIKEVFK